MKHFAAALLLLTGCATAGDVAAPVAVPDAASSEQRITELQTALTETLERIDVLSDRLARLEEGAPPAGVVAVDQTRRTAPEPVTRPAEPAPAAEPQQRASSEAVQPALAGAELADRYRAAISLFGRGSHAEARRAFETIHEADPSGSLADNALFWIGESYFASGDYTNAVRFYARVVSEYPDANKAADALFKQGLAIERTGDLSLARKTLQQVVERYPFSTAAASAQNELRRIRF